MDIVDSADGTSIAYQQVGEGPVVVIIGGALSTASDAGDLASGLAGEGFRAVTWDRRARGSSGDARGSTPEREADDLAAVIGAAGGNAIVLGHSSGSILALYAASLGVPMKALFLSEPPFRFGVDEPADDLAERLQGLVDQGDAAEAVVTFQLEGVGLPKEMVDQIRASDQFERLVPLGQSTVVRHAPRPGGLHAHPRNAYGVAAGDRAPRRTDLPDARDGSRSTRRSDRPC